jgi:hypothetical protein
MDLIIKQSNLDDLKTKLRKKYPQLTEKDLQHNEGTEESMLRMVEYKLRKTKQEMTEIIKKL